MFFIVVVPSLSCGCITFNLLGEIIQGGHGIVFLF